jgi:hypothetical protein
MSVLVIPCVSPLKACWAQSLQPEGRNIQQNHSVRQRHFRNLSRRSERCIFFQRPDRIARIQDSQCFVQNFFQIPKFVVCTLNWQLHKNNESWRFLKCSFGWNRKKWFYRKPKLSLWRYCCKNNVYADLKSEKFLTNSKYISTAMWLIGFT